MEKLFHRTLILREINNLLSYRFLTSLEEILPDSNELDDLINHYIVIRHKLGEPHSKWFRLVFGKHLPICNRTNDYITRKI